MRIVVTGSREYRDVYSMRRALKVFLDEDNQLAHGDAKGADRLAGSIWDAWHWDKAFTYPADWQTYGKAAGPLRNRWMIDDFEPDIVLAFFVPGLECKGTWDCVEYAQSKGIKVDPYRAKDY